MKPGKIFLVTLVVVRVLAWLMIPVVIIVPVYPSRARASSPSRRRRESDAGYRRPISPIPAGCRRRVSLTLAVSSAVVAGDGHGRRPTRAQHGRQAGAQPQVILMLPLVVADRHHRRRGVPGLCQRRPARDDDGLILANVMLGSALVTSVLVGLRKFDPGQEMVSRSRHEPAPHLRGGAAADPGERDFSGLLFAFISALDETGGGAVVHLPAWPVRALTPNGRMFRRCATGIDPTIAAISLSSRRLSCSGDPGLALGRAETKKSARHEDRRSRVNRRRVRQRARTALRTLPAM